jgi:hypothetical protein
MSQCVYLIGVRDDEVRKAGSRERDYPDRASRRANEGA